MLVIPAIDVLDGKVVRLAQGDFAQPVTVFGNEPLEIAARYGRAGTTRLHLVNLLGARRGTASGRPLPAIARNTI